MMALNARVKVSGESTADWISGVWGVSGNTEFQVSAGVKKRLSAMTRAEASRVVNAMIADNLMRLHPEEFGKHAASDPAWASSIRDLAERIHSVKNPEEDDDSFLLIRI